MGFPAAAGHPTHSLRVPLGDFLISNPNCHTELFVECPYTIREVPEANLMAEVTQLLQLATDRRAGVFVDVGAHCGFWSLAFGSLFSRVLAIEPSNYQYKLLRRNCRRNSAENVVAIKAALSNYCGTSTIFVTGRSGGGNSLERPLTEPISRQRCKVATLDSFALHEIDFLKIDVEGHEIRVLEGAHSTLRLHKPHILFEANVDPRPIVDLLSNLGYKTGAMTTQTNMFLARPT